ncbi:MAG: N-acetylmuramoyl-L-alanine amidase [Acetobacter sp.]|jgi:N-acetylmuramoyl-L-alanine amidase|nr:N-acetylmuramoyl-L-alanine amidase [Acetobacter sp.]MCH4060852.1 N-acetylmuramoyl-L-alanine amidase [Acetobacter sp.]MCH4087792.1 N-acetylmuramoyl-L-alanine amidase [Acetobacter sp.]MCI1293691.1 N-acetylmuramoyl-L-alanine amidase [Acetobacter sp.]MCI1319876.1 N-acetylmuramoyl-L-alanine amidase [Acetobacter sp.]
MKRPESSGSTSEQSPSFSTELSRRTILTAAAGGLLAIPASANSRTTSPHPHLAAPAISHNIPPLIVLDPGHGGKDPGAIGHSGTYEKHISIAAAHELQRQLTANNRYRVTMTRTADHFIPLEQRVEIAQQKRAALFISMHADALHDPHICGASVYTLSSHASDAQSAALAAKENNADAFGEAHFHATSPEVQAILASLVTEETRQGSARLAGSIVSSFGPKIALLHNPSRHAAFVVLKSAQIPSVLVEMGFMSNAQDEQSLKRPEHRQKIAISMRSAVDRYFSNTSTGNGNFSG